MTGVRAVRVEVREARPEEYEALGEIAVRAYSALGGETDTAYMAHVRDVARRARRAPVLAAVDGEGALLGTVTYVPGPANRYADVQRHDEAGFRMLAVAPTAQGGGVGRALVEAVIERARSEGRAGIAIFTRPSMRVAHRLYHALGFRRDPSDDREFEPGEWLWAFRLKL